MIAINSLWISGELQPINHLTIKSFKEHGHNFILWTYEKDLKVDCEVRDAREIMSEDQIFYYKVMMEGKPEFKFGGIAERLKSELLYAVGGWHVDLDVVCLKPFDDLTAKYVLAPHPLGVIGNIIKAPALSKFAEYYRTWTRTIDENNNTWSKSFQGLNTAILFLGLEKYKVSTQIFGMDGEEYIKPLLLNSGLIPSPERYAIHWCGAMKWYEANEEGSYYDSLLKKYKLK